MSKEPELWQFISSRLSDGDPVMLLVVAHSSGSSPGRSGYKMAVAADGELCGSIGGGVMEVRLVEKAKAIISEPGTVARGFSSATVAEQVHQRNVTNSSGMICSGKQTIIFQQLTSAAADTVNSIAMGLQQQNFTALEISNLKFQLVENTTDNSRRYFSQTSERDFVYQEKLGSANKLYIIGGGHCALALSQLMARLDFRISIVDDRPELNTLEKNEFADEFTIIESYEKIGDLIASGEDTYVVVMTLGYASDAVVIRKLIDREFKYFGVLGSRAKMAMLMKELRAEGIDDERLSKIRTPIGLSINSRTPEEIAVSIAAEIISVKNRGESPA